MTTSGPWLVAVDDNEDWRAGLVRALRARPGAPEVAYAGPDVNEAIRAASTHAGSTLALIDAHAPDGSAGVVAVRGLHDAGIPVAVMSAHFESAVLIALVRAGAFGCVLKSDVLDSLEGIASAAWTGTPYLTAALTGCLLTTAAAAELPRAQRQAMQWHAAGIPLDIALQSQGLAEGEYATVIDGLVQALRVPDHGTATSS